MIAKHWIVKDNAASKDIIDTLLNCRGIENKEEFLNPTHPQKISLKEAKISEKEMKLVINRLTEAKEKQEKVIIYGDYDVDGACSTSVLWEALTKFGIIAFPFIPDRFSEGYGMSEKGVKKVLEAHPDAKLVITVDNGIVAHEAITFAKEKGLEVIVTDHHEELSRPPALAVVHTTLMCGTAVAWFVARELLGKEESDWLDDSLDLVGIATIADQMKLLGLNRSLAYHGIQALRKTKRVGLVALFQASAVVPQKVGTYEIGFVLGPRMNAAGRLAHAIDVVRLLCTKSRERAVQIAASLSELNASRQDILQNVLLVARKEINNEARIVIVKGEFHEGVIGLAAGRIVEETGKPTLVLTKADSHFKGSARSISGFNITDAFREFTQLLLSVGGHEMAAGLSISEENLDTFIEGLTKYAEVNIADDLLVKKLHIDCALPLEVVNESLAKELTKLEPFGIGNPKPVFITEEVLVSDIKYMGKTGDHVKLLLDVNGKKLQALLFNGKEKIKGVKVGETVSLVYNIELNEWMGTTSVQLNIKDFSLEEKSSTNINGRTRKRVQSASTSPRKKKRS